MLKWFFLLFFFSWASGMATRPKDLTMITLSSRALKLAGDYCFTVLSWGASVQNTLGDLNSSPQRRVQEVNSFTNSTFCPSWWLLKVEPSSVCHCFTFEFFFCLLHLFVNDQLKIFNCIHINFIQCYWHWH